MARGRLTTRERQDRDERIRAASGRGEHPAAIGRREGISERQVRRVLATLQQRQEVEPEAVANLLEIDPHRELAEAVEAYRWAIREARGIGERTASASLRLGAAKAVPTLATGLLDLLARANLIPQVPEWWLSDVQLRMAVDALREAAEEQGVEPAAMDQAMADRLSDVMGEGFRLGVVSESAVAA
jgi:hypothetical protein